MGLSIWQGILLRRSNAHPVRYLPLALSFAPIAVLASFMLEGAFDWQVWLSLLGGAVAILAIVLLVSRKAGALSAAPPPTRTQSFVSGFSGLPMYLLVVLPLIRERNRELARGIVVTHGVVAANVADSLERLHPTSVPKGARFLHVRREAFRTSFVPGDWNGPQTVCHAQPLHISVDLLKWPDSPSDSAFEARAIKAARAFLASHRRSVLAKPTMTIKQCAEELRNEFNRELGQPQRVATSAWLSSPDSALNTPAASPRSPR